MHFLFDWRPQRRSLIAFRRQGLCPAPCRLRSEETLVSIPIRPRDKTASFVGRLFEALFTPHLWSAIREHPCSGVNPRLVPLLCPNYAAGGPPPCGEHTHAGGRVRVCVEGRADIWYMRAMINRLIRNGARQIHFAHQKLDPHTAPVCVRDWLPMCVCGCVCVPGAYQRELQPICPAVIRATFLSDRCAARPRPDCLSPLPKELRQRVGAAPSLKTEKKEKVASNSSMSE